MKTVSCNAFLTVNGRELTIDGISGLARTSEVSVRWGRPSARTHPEPGRVTVTVHTSSPRAPFTLGDELTVDVQIYDAQRTIRITRAWVDTIQTTPTGNRWRHTAGCIDVLGRAQAARLAAQPWPRHTREERAAAINAASPTPLIDSNKTGGTVYMAARDVDRAPALDVIRRTLAEPGITADETSSGIGAGATPGAVIAWPFSMQGQLISGALDRADPIPVPASAIYSRDRLTDRRDLLSAIEYVCQLQDPADAAATIETTLTTYATPRRTDEAAVLRVVTDIWLRSISDQPAHPWSLSVLGESQTPAPRLDGPQGIDPTQIAPHALTFLVDMDTRSTALIRIGDCPEDLDSTHRIISGEVTITGQNLRLVLTLEPSRISGTRPLRWRDVPQKNTTFDLLAASQPLITGAHRITYADTALVANPARK